LSDFDPLAIVGVSIFTVCLLLIMVSIGLQAASKKELSFKVMRNMLITFLYTLIHSWCRKKLLYFSIDNARVIYTKKV
jgi:mannose/fructose/N-acetylgalactosamine-specific phosphotransferase system component IID